MANKGRFRYAKLLRVNHIFECENLKKNMGSKYVAIRSVFKTVKFRSRVTHHCPSATWELHVLFCHKANSCQPATRSREAESPSNPMVNRSIIIFRTKSAMIWGSPIFGHTPLANGLGSSCSGFGNNLVHGFQLPFFAQVDEVVARTS